MVSRHTKPKTVHPAAALSLLCLLGGAPETAQAQAPAPPAVAPPAPASPPAQAGGPGPATQPPPPPGTAVPGPTQPAPVTPAAPAATPPPNYNIQTSGLIDFYYQFAFSNPKFNAPGFTNNNLGNRYYDFRNNSPTVALAELDVFQNPRPNNFGFHVTFLTGDTADLNHGGSIGVGQSPFTPGTGESRFKNVQQIYGTYALGGNGAGVDFGKFLSPFGYEVAQSNGDYNHSRSLAYNIVPVYHGGARIYTPVPGVNGLTATFYLVNALYNSANAGVQDDNKQPAYIGQLNYTDPKGKFTLISELGLAKDKTGVDKVGTTVNTRNTLSDTNFTYNFSANLLAGLDYVYLMTAPNGGFKNTTNGYAVYFRQQMTPKTAYALRLSGYDVKYDGAQQLPNTRPFEVTATYEYKAAANLLTRLEYRHDDANEKGPLGEIFAGGSGSPTKSNQDTVSVSGVFTF